jgi:hypothetical protein
LHCEEENGRLSPTVGLVVSMYIGVGAAKQSNLAQSLATGKTFIAKIAEINLAEIELGRLAEQNASNLAIKDFRAKDDPGPYAGRNDLQQLANSKGSALEGICFYIPHA